MTRWPPAARLRFSWLWLAYPILIFIGLQFLAPRYLALLTGVILLLRWRNALPSMLARFSWLQKAAALLLLSWLVVTCISNNETLLKIYPAMINLIMLLIFGLSLKYPPSMIEVFARIQQPELPAAAINYTRHVTMVWCLFFLINGSLAAYTAMNTSRETWAFYNGFLTYIIMGILFAGEWLVRRRLMARQIK